MTVRLNNDAVSHANGLIRRGEYAKWHLAEDTVKTDGTKGRFSR